MLKNIVRSLLIALAVVFASTLVPVAAFANEAEAGESGTQSTTSEDKDTTTRSKTANRIAEDKTSENTSDSGTAERSKRLSAAKLKVCTQRTKTINNIMVRGVTRAQNQIKVFSTIAERVKAFYEKKGKTLANYDQLVAAASSAKATAETTLSDLKTNTFSCDSEDPKAQVEAFKTSLQSLNTALKAYRTAVKDLIVGVKSVQGEDQ